MSCNERQPGKLKEYLDGLPCIRSYLGNGLHGGKR
nr:MAG TPA: hypothetical protein [Caudoviricetes sp.]